ncbi:MAG: Fe-S cluster assembly protein SufD [Chloroflexi bacterium 13_1_20CM_66_33]|nr:MAG: Fe-S cluster assembly protein SufD [Chloroflexi bacterium 13_1_20CM_66_33]
MTAVADRTGRYVADFAAFARNGASGAPQWLRELREGAIARFAELGFPTMKQEEWRFTSVAPITDQRFVLAHAPRSPLPAPSDIERLCLGVGPRVVFVDGRHAPALSTSADVTGGVRAGSLAAAFRDKVGGGLAREHLARHAPWHDSAFAALNTAFLADGAFVHVPAGVTLERPLEVVFLSTGRAMSNGPIVSHPRSLIVVERGAQASVVETYAGLSDGVYWTNAVTEVVVGDGARAELYRVQREGQHGFQVATTHSRQERDSFLGVHVMTLGAALARHDITTVLAGAGAELILNGLYLLSDGQHADHHTVIDHAQPHCASHEFFNGVLAGRSHGVFNGRIVVRPGAQRTDSKQTNNNLLLSTEARADSQPQLEIYADDVKCTHGSTVGPIDQMQLYYLRSRGLSPAAARSILTYGFGAEILDRMRQPDVRNRLDGLVRERLA